MLFRLNIQDSRKVRVIVPHDSLQRICKKHFRGGHETQTGNFAGNILFDSHDDLLHFSAFKGMMREEMAEMVEAKEFGVFSTTLQFRFPVGWSSTDDSRNYRADDLEEFEPSRNSTALRVKRERDHLLAPRTRDLTVVYELTRLEEYEPVCFIHSLYPGKDIGELRGNITKREGVVFFDWEHRGQ